MNRIEEMIRELCPKGVEYLKLVNVCKVQYGYPFEAALFTDDNTYIPIIRIRDVKPAKANTFYTGEILQNYIVRKGDILIGMDGNFNLEKWNDRDGLLNQRVCKVCTKKEEVIINGFLYHLLPPIFKGIEDEIKGGTVKHLSAARINKIVIPVPPLAIQNEIVNILDKFTQLEAELKAKLEAELEARRKQYEYYRNKLLNFNNFGGGLAM